MCSSRNNVILLDVARECNEIIQIKLLLTSRALLLKKKREKSCRHSQHFDFVI